MRKILRSMAKARMRELGCTKLFKKKMNSKKTKKISAFARFWRAYASKQAMWF